MADHKSYYYSILSIATNGRLNRLFTPFKVIDISDGKHYWVNRIYFDSFGIPYYLVNNMFRKYSEFKILHHK